MMKLADVLEVETVRDSLIEAARAALRRSGINVETVTELGGFLRLLERLPDCDNDSLGMLSVPKGGVTCEVSISSDELRLSETVTYDFGAGSNQETTDLLTITENGAEHDDQFTLWLRDFVTMAGDSECELDCSCE